MTHFANYVSRRSKPYISEKMKMKSATIVASFVALSFAAGTASAGKYGQQPQAVVVAPEVAPAAITDWSGAYIGGTLSYFRGAMSFCDDGFGQGYECDDLQVNTPRPRASGGMVGLTAGYDWQSGALVYGVVGDLMFGNLSGSAPSTTGSDSYGCGDGCNLEVDGFAMLRGRVGYAMDSFLVFGSAGVAATRVSVGETGVSSTSGTVTNLVLGVGAEYMVTDSMSVGMEALHFFKNADPVIDDDFCGVGACGATDFSATSLRLSINYRF